MLKNSLERRLGLDEEMVSALCAVLCKYPQIAAAYVFGSYASGKARADSDVDVAILLLPGTEVDLLKIMMELSDAVGKEVDAVILNRAGEILKYQVRKKGVLIYDVAPDVRKRFENISRKAWEDFRYYHRRYIKHVLGLRNGR